MWKYRGTQVNTLSATPKRPDTEEVSWRTGEDHSGKGRFLMYCQLTESERYTLSLLKRHLERRYEDRFISHVSSFVTPQLIRNIEI